ncbi:MAG TPA: secretin N-terminal domain-containing protein [Candidatus Omnitrophota bacterium]|nr:secretin N-terminal domain-containing protein [Candidatus Omnitrophota bacterium]HRZ14521.1 secretin N-terminal domain-containing protein [Candidatus Omnitrophota bacterium]
MTRTGTGIILAMVMAAATLNAAPVPAQDTVTGLPGEFSTGLSRDAGFPETIISLDLRDMDILEAIKFIAEKTGLNIIPTKAVTGRVSLTVKDVSVKDVFDIILRSNNLAYEKRGNIYNIMTETEYKAYYGRNFYDARVTKVFRLQYAIPEQALNLLQSTKSEVGKVLLDAESGVIIVVDTPDRVRSMTDTLKAMEHKSVIRVFNLKYARAKDIEEQLKGQLDVKKVGSIKADERTNQVVVQTLPDRMEGIEKLILGLDLKTRQILMDAKIIQVKLNDTVGSGVEWEGLFNLGKKHGLTYLGSYPFSSVQAATDVWRSRKDTYTDVGNVGSYPFTGTSTDYTAGNQSTATEEMHLGVVGKNDFDVIIKYLQTIGQTRILSNPKLAVVNNQEARIHVGERQAYITTTTTQTQTSTTVSEAVTYVDVGIQLMVTPTINEDGFVTVKIKPEISSVLDYLETSSNNRIPIIDTSTAETIVMVKDGTSILIGGLSKEEKNQNSSGTPFLSKIPFLGNAFKTSTTRTSRSELIVLLTPHVISGDELVTDDSREFGRFLDKEYKGYPEFTDDPARLEIKSYQEYPALDADDVMADIKPARNF